MESRPGVDVVSTFDRISEISHRWPGCASNEGPEEPQSGRPKQPPCARTAPVPQIFLGPLWWPPETCSNLLTSGPFGARRTALGGQGNVPIRQGYIFSNPSLFKIKATLPILYLEAARKERIRWIETGTAGFGMDAQPPGSLRR